MKIEEIKCGDFTAKINVSRGGNCISLRNEKNNCRILREPDYEKGIDNPYLYGMPVLFPVNRISGGSFEFEGRMYTFPINEKSTNCFLHGTLHEMEFEVKEQEKDRILLLYKATKEKPYLTFPHAFEMWLEYSLSQNGLTLKIRICNVSDENMPIFLGFHTTFNIPFVKGSKKEDQIVKVDCGEEFERDMSTFLPTGNVLVRDEVSRKLAEGIYVPNQRISRHYRSSKAGVMAITDSETGISVIYENSSELAYRLVYGEGSDFICLEPQTCVANCVNATFSREDVGFMYIRPNETKEFWSNIRIGYAGVL